MSLATPAVSLWAVADATVRAKLNPRRSRPLITLLLIAGPLYGGVMGSYGGLAAERLPQILYSAAKMPVLLLGTFFISLPSFFVLNTLLGLRSDFRESVRALLATQAGLTVFLAALSPYTWLWYVSGSGYRPAILFNAVMFAIATFAAQFLLRRYYRPLIARNPLHRTTLRVWLVVYVFVGIQMGWVLRPFIGNPDLPPQLFREGAWGNAYLEVAQIVWSVLGG